MSRLSNRVRMLHSDPMPQRPVSLRVGASNKGVVFEFGSSVERLDMPYAQAKAFAEAILAVVNARKMWPGK